MNNIFEKENGSDNYSSELSEDSNNFSIESNFANSEYGELKIVIKNTNKTSITRNKIISKNKTKKSKEVTINYKNFKNNRIHNKKINDDSFSSESDSSSNSSNSLKIESESDNKDNYNPIKVNIIN